MPLPPALAARLAKRGIISEDYVHSEEKKAKQVEEEVIAENYDSNYKNRLDGEDILEISAAQAVKHFKGHPGCPNKWNIHHECNSYCIRRWGRGNVNPDPKYLRKQALLLAKYPLPHGWKEVYDPGVGRHYYWEMSTDMVSWLPPGHPKAVLSESAATLREEKHLAATDLSDHESESGEEEEEERPREEREKERERDRDRDRDKEKKRRDGRVKAKSNDLDPMDPAAYSQAPRGKWSDGLERGNEAKTGADVTATGPLFQMRPYPNPGAVLRANAAAKTSQP